MLNTNDYRIAPGGEGPQASTWKDKPHRLIYDLCREVERLEADLAAEQRFHRQSRADFSDLGGRLEG